MLDLTNNIESGETLFSIPRGKFFVLQFRTMLQLEFQVEYNYQIEK